MAAGEDTGAGGGQGLQSPGAGPPAEISWAHSEGCGGSAWWEKVKPGCEGGQEEVMSHGRFPRGPPVSPAAWSPVGKEPGILGRALEPKEQLVGTRGPLWFVPDMVPGTGIGCVLNQPTSFCHETKAQRLSKH